MNILLIAGSPTTPSSSGALLSAVGKKFARAGLAPQPLRLRDLPAMAMLLGEVDHPALKAALTQVAEAEAIVIATPVCKAAYSGLLKVFLDLLPADALCGKTVLPIATGGGPSNLRAIDRALQPVLSALGADDILEMIFVADGQVGWRDFGAYEFEIDIGHRLDDVARLLNERQRSPRCIGPMPSGMRPPRVPAFAARCSA
jgi:FMN reductase